MNLQNSIEFKIKQLSQAQFLLQNATSVKIIADYVSGLSK